MFCVIKGFERDGVAKIIKEGGTGFLVEYFDHPDYDGRITRQVCKTDIIPKKLGRNTRAYAFNDFDQRWKVGRVVEDDGNGLHLRFAHKEDVYLSHENVFVRWKKPIKNPIVFLSKFITETPQYAEARSNYLESYISQRGVAFGIKALLSSSIDLESHQIDVIRRVLNDPSQRYLLADEVGLGKTIEAGIIIRQAILDDPRNHHVIVFVPRALVKQWREELIRRFGLKRYIDESVFVFPHTLELEHRSEIKRSTMLVIDEAHHIADPNADQDIYEFIRSIALNTEKLLLLSATPILRNEIGFLRMLHLLDPVVYPLSNYERFRLKIEQRQALAEVVAMLVPENSLFLDTVLDDLIDHIPNDLRLQMLVGKIKDLLVGVPDEEDPVLVEEIRKLRAHISETYKLNRRILRNRRRRICGLTPDRSQGKKWSVVDSSMLRLESALELWRMSACFEVDERPNSELKQTLRSFYWQMVSTYLEGPGPLKLLCESRRANGFEQEDDLLDKIINLCDESRWLSNRIAEVVVGIMALPNKTKAVLFCSTTNTADSVFADLKTHRLNVVRHKIDLDDGAETGDQESWHGFMTDPDVRAIVCDSRAEEGLNLQGGNKVVIHFDLPLQPNRIEQRIGRVDRYGAGMAIESFALIEHGARIQEAWFTLLQDGWGVFKQSISCLQYLVEDELAGLKDQLFLNGVEAIEYLLTRLKGPTGLVASELKLIDQQDALDELSPLPEVETEDLFDIDGAWKCIKESMLYWITDTLLFEKVPVRADMGSPIDQPFRLHYHPPESSGQATLIPLSGFLDDFLGAVDYEARGNRASQPRSFILAANRRDAVKRGIRLLRYGDEFVEAIRSFSDMDDRGRSFAAWRQIHEGFDFDNFKMCFRIDFVIEAQLKHAEEVLGTYCQTKAKNCSTSALARRGDSLFHPFSIHAWVDEDGHELDDDFVMQFLSHKYAKEGGENYIDKNLGSEHFGALRKLAPNVFSNWSGRCDRVLQSARSVVLARPQLAERKRSALKQAKMEDEIRYAQLRTRIQSLDGNEAESERLQLALEEGLNDALQKGISDPVVRVDVVGVIFLSNKPVSIIDSFMGRRYAV